MHAKDVVSKDILKRIALDIARILLHLKVDHAELLETEHQRVEERRADVVVLVQGESGRFILHLEIQNDNQANIAWRLLRYRSDIGLAHKGYDIKQYLIYIGKAPLSMPTGIHQTGLDYRYHVIDMHSVDCQALLTQDTPDALVLAILCDFKGRSEREVVRYIIQRLQELTAENESRYHDYMRMLEILSANRSLEKIIEEEEAMLSVVDQTRLPSFRIGMRHGIEQGVQQGTLSLVKRQLTRRFGTLSYHHVARLDKLNIEQLEELSDALLDFNTVTDFDVWLENRKN
uniref:DUF4351 domain-containing protein n=1 Tax=Chlorobium chlorochromatii (strain CaD3) TaxID=340177 RepID=Q3ATN4_CHLCH